MTDVPDERFTEITTIYSVGYSKLCPRCESMLGSSGTGLLTAGPEGTMLHHPECPELANKDRMSTTRRVECPGAPTFYSGGSVQEPHSWRFLRRAPGIPEHDEEFTVKHLDAPEEKFTQKVGPTPPEDIFYCIYCLAYRHERAIY